MEIVNLSLTNIDLKLFLENYNVYDLQYINGWKFKCIKDLFKDYIDKWIGVKIANKGKNKGMYTLAKLMLNSLYGKFSTSLETRGKIPRLEEEIVKYSLGDYEIKKGLYLPVRCVYYILCKRTYNENSTKNKRLFF